MKNENTNKAEGVKLLINYKEVSRVLAKNETSISKSRCPKKYENDVDNLLLKVDEWQSKLNLKQD